MAVTSKPWENGLGRAYALLIAYDWENGADESLDEATALVRAAIPASDAYAIEEQLEKEYAASGIGSEG